MKIILLFALSLGLYVSLHACEITTLTDKEAYAIGDTAIVSVTVKLTHGKCNRETIEPVLTATGAKVIAKTAYKKNESGAYEIKYKISVTEKKATLTLEKVCPKGGDATTVTLKVK